MISVTVFARPLLRRGIQAVLSDTADLRIVGEGATEAEALRLLRAEHVDIALLELDLPGINFDTINRVRSAAEAVRVLCLSIHLDPLTVSEALRCGAAGVVGHESTPDELVTGLRTVAANRRYLPAGHISRAAQAKRRAQSDAYLSLTPREREVFGQVAIGCSNPMIADQLGISVRTVETHRASAMRKLKLTCVADLVRYAMSRQLIPPPGKPGGAEKAG